MASGEKSGTGEFQHDSLQDATSIVTYLEALAQGFSSGRLEFSSGKKAILLRPTGLLELSVKAKKKGGNARLVLDGSWREPRRKKSTQTPLKIKVAPERE